MISDNEAMRTKVRLRDSATAFSPSAVLEAARQAVGEEHLGPVCDGFELSPLEISDALGEQGFARLMGCAFEDFLTCRFEPDQRNIVDDYLKRRGWKESEPGKRYLSALRHSVMSVYAGGGLVADSVPETEYQESQNKAAAVLGAASAASAVTKLGEPSEEWT